MVRRSSISPSVKPLTANLAVAYALFGILGPRLAQKPLTLLVLTSTPSPLAISSGRSAGAVVHTPPVDGKGALPLLAAASDEAPTAAYAGVAEHQIDVVGGVLALQLVAEAQDLRLLGDVAYMAADEYAAARAGLRGGRRLGDRVAVPITRRDRASPMAS